MRRLMSVLFAAVLLCLPSVSLAQGNAFGSSNTVAVGEVIYNGTSTTWGMGTDSPIGCIGFFVEKSAGLFNCRMRLGISVSQFPKGTD
jgi:hypothetical protein